MMDTKNLETPYPKGSSLDRMYKGIVRNYGIEPTPGNVALLTLKVLQEIRGALNLIAVLIVLGAILGGCAVAMNF